MAEAAERFPGGARPLAGRRRRRSAATSRRLDDLGKRVADGSPGRRRPGPAGGTVVVATHGGAARQGIGHLLGWPASSCARCGPCRTATGPS